MNTPVIETIVLPAETLATLPASMLANVERGFSDAFAKAEELRIRALSIVVRDHTDFDAMKEARAVRLELKEIRVAAEKSRKAMKEDSLRMGRAIDGVYNLLEAAVVPLEKYLSEAENTAALHAEREKARKVAERMDALLPFLRPGAPLPDLAALDDDQWTDYFADAKLLHASRVEQERKIEAERIAREQAEAAERERVKLDNARLMAEAAEREAAMEKERKAAAAARKAIEDKARAELAKAEKQLAQERAEAAAKAAKIQAALDKERAEAKAKEEAAAKAAKAEAAAARKAARAPDREKLNARIAAYLAVADSPVIMSTTEGQELLDELTGAIAAICNRIGAKLNALE